MHALMHTEVRRERERDKERKRDKKREMKTKKERQRERERQRLRDRDGYRYIYIYVYRCLQTPAVLPEVIPRAEYGNGSVVLTVGAVHWRRLCFST